jgi:hypothetical protein
MDPKHKHYLGPIDISTFEDTVHQDLWPYFAHICGKGANGIFVNDSGGMAGMSKVTTLWPMGADKKVTATTIQAALKAGARYAAGWSILYTCYQHY